MRAWLKSNWKAIAGAACGAGAAGLAVVNPAAGLALGAVCGAAFGKNAATLGRQLAELVTSTLTDQDKGKGK